jgi:hypothetical protein
MPPSGTSGDFLPEGGSQGAVSTGAERTVFVREHRMRSGNAADDPSWTGA